MLLFLQENYARLDYSLHIFKQKRIFFFAVFLNVKKDEGKQKKSENSHQSFVAAVARFSTTLLSNYERTGCRSQSRNSSISTLLLESRQTSVWRVRKWMNFIKYLSHFSIFFHQPNRQQYFHFLVPSNLFFFIEKWEQQSTLILCLTSMHIYYKRFNHIGVDCKTYTL